MTTSRLIAHCDKCGNSRIVYATMNAICSKCNNLITLTPDEMKRVRAEWPWLLSESKANAPKKEKPPKEEYVKGTPGLKKRKLKPLDGQASLFQLDSEADFG